ncbi:hypothetical protein [Mesorhizobium sp.]|uniref:hypothetical protein n=1 Tax=Mesorhizobium sp. TaxID=1871066 RepID=UPI0025EEF1E0|nr:hypothetical protein [Mesorhizobium sp.]
MTVSGAGRGGLPIGIRSAGVDPVAVTKMLILQQKTPKWALDASARLPLAR